MFTSRIAKAKTKASVLRIGLLKCLISSMGLRMPVDIITFNVASGAKIRTIPMCLLRFAK